MSQLPDFFKKPLEDFMGSFSGDNTGEQLLNMGLGYFLSDSMETTKPQVGYQGKIEDLVGVRQQIANPAPAAKQGIALDTGRKDMETGEPITRTVADPSVRGAKGRSYFTDMKYAKPDASRAEPPTEAEARAANKAEAQGIFAQQNPAAENPYSYAQGGIAGTHKGYYLGGKTDGMADNVPARIDGKQEARLSDGEFVVPADVVSHLGNGNSDAGADQLHSMMGNIRQARTGNSEQGKQINPQQFMPKMAQGGLAQFAGGGSVFKRQPYKTNFNEEGSVQGSTDDQSPSETGSSGEQYGKEIGTESSLSNWAGDYVTGMLAQGQALGNLGYNEAGFAYTGDLSAGTSNLQDQSNLGIAALNDPTSGGSIVNQMGAFDPSQENLNTYMNPYTQEVIDRTAADMRRQDQISQLQQRQQLTSAGAFGGSRDALLRAEGASNLNRNIGDMSAEQRAANYTQAMDRGIAAQQNTNQYGFDVLGAQGKAGADQRAIEQERIAAEYAQFREQREFPYKQVQYLQSLLQGLPLAAQSTTYSEPSQYDKLMQGAAASEEVQDYLSSDDSGSDTELNYDINNDGVVDEYDVGPAQPV